MPRPFDENKKGLFASTEKGEHFEADVSCLSHPLGECRPRQSDPVAAPSASASEPTSLASCAAEGKREKHVKLIKQFPKLHAHSNLTGHNFQFELSFMAECLRP